MRRRQAIYFSLFLVAIAACVCNCTIYDTPNLRRHRQYTAVVCAIWFLYYWIEQGGKHAHIQREASHRLISNKHLHKKLSLKSIPLHRRLLHACCFAISHTELHTRYTSIYTHTYTYIYKYIWMCICNAHHHQHHHHQHIAYNTHIRSFLSLYPTRHATQSIVTTYFPRIFTPLTLLTHSLTRPKRSLHRTRTVNAMYVSCISYPSYTFYASYPFYQQLTCDYGYLLTCMLLLLLLLLPMLLLMCRFTLPMQRCGTGLSFATCTLNCGD